MESRGRKCKQLLDDLKETRGYCKLKQETLDRTLWRTGFGRGYGPVVRRSTELINLTSVKWKNVQSQFQGHEKTTALNLGKCGHDNVTEYTCRKSVKKKKNN